jgi:molybdenum cofactor synthesis domain-containing protein
LSEGKEDHEHPHYHGVDKAEQHISVSDALTSFLREIRTTKSEKITLDDCTDRVLFSDVSSPQNLPRLARSSRDGYAIKLPEISTDPASWTFKLTGEVRIGKISSLVVNAGEAARVATGSFIPTGANTVVMREYSTVEDGTLQISKSPKLGENIVSPGEDLKKGELLFKAGTVLRPHHIALLAMVGIGQARVYSKPRIAIFSTGDELRNLETRSSKNSMTATYDSNRPFLSSAVTEIGGTPIDLGIARDNFEEIRMKMASGLKFDGLLLSAGSSVGERDYVAKAAESIKDLRMLIHGVAMRPSSPTGLAIYRGKPVVFLPGFPTSAIVSFYVFGRPAVLKLSGSSNTEMPTFPATMEDDYDGKPGLTHFLRVRIHREGELMKATIVRPTEAQYSSWLRAANGIAIIGLDAKSMLRRGDEVSVFPIGNI